MNIQVGEWSQIFIHAQQADTRGSPGNQGAGNQLSGKGNGGPAGDVGAVIAECQQMPGAADLVTLRKAGYLHEHGAFFAHQRCQEIC